MVTYHLTASGGGADTNLTNVTKLHMEKRSDLSVMTFPGADSTEVYADDMDGATRTINLEGVLADTAANIGTFINAIEGMVNGAQMDATTKVVFHSDVPTNGGAGTTYTVTVEKFTWELTSETPGGTGGLASALKYTIDMTQSTN